MKYLITYTTDYGTFTKTIEAESSLEAEDILILQFDYENELRSIDIVQELWKNHQKSAKNANSAKKIAVISVVISGLKNSPIIIDLRALVE